MTVAESKSLKKGSRVYWQGDADDSGRITEISWDAVTIAWDNGQVATVHHGESWPVHSWCCSRSKRFSSNSSINGFGGTTFCLVQRRLGARGDR